jgi:transcriptional regulator with XRE-family HTH domain
LGLLCTPEICWFPARGAFLNRCGKLSKVTGMDRFGVPFGRLVREKRGIEGLSQDGLAEKSGLTKARISDIETGKIANPHIKTIDALCVALNISCEERAACHTAPASGLPSRLLEKLARQFGRDMPEATEEELEAFLMAKAEEFREMRTRWRDWPSPKAEYPSSSRPLMRPSEKVTSKRRTAFCRKPRRFSFNRAPWWL